MGTCGGIATSGGGLPDLGLELEAFLPSRFFCLSCRCCDSFDDALPLLMTMMMMVVVEVMIKIMGNPYLLVGGHHQHDGGGSVL